VKIAAQLFGQLRDVASVSELEINLVEGTTVADLLAALYERVPALRDWDKSILVAAGVEFVGRDYILQREDQISIMPPVQGG